jgi:hypothetical protein
VVSTAGHVTNARALAGGQGVSTLRYDAGGPAPVIVLDYGRDVGGYPSFQVGTVTGSPTLHASYSEALRYLDLDGDNNGEGPCCGNPAGDPHRYDDYQVTANQQVVNPAVQGGERYQYLTLTTPGTVELRRASIVFGAYRAEPSAYQGWFLSSDRLLNRIWYSGAYTTQLNMVPAGVDQAPGPGVVVDGGKRDRAIWSGDLVVQLPTIWTSLGTNGSGYVRASLERIATFADPSGALPGLVMVPVPVGLVFSSSYSMRTVEAIVDYYRLTGDETFARQLQPAVEAELALNASQVDARGLLVTQPAPLSPTGGLDWDPYNGPKAGAVTAYNVLYYHVLQEAAYLEAHLGAQAAADDDLARATALRTSIDANLWNPATGVYDLSDSLRGTVAEDANALAVLYGVADQQQTASILTGLRRLWTTCGALAYSADTGFNPLISPFVNGFETAARLQSGDASSALALLRSLWGTMIRRGPDTTGTFWEAVTPACDMAVTGTGNPIDNDSLAHGWASGPTWQLSTYVLGVRPVDPGYRTWVLSPQPGDLKWAEGRVPTAAGPFPVRWSRSVRNGRFQLSFTPPAGTSGTVVVPELGTGQRVALDGHPVSNGPIAVDGGARHVVVISEEGE